MDDLKAKLKKLSMNPFKKTPSGFKGQGRVLGSTEPDGAGASSSSPAGGSRLAPQPRSALRVPEQAALSTIPQRPFRQPEQQQAPSHRPLPQTTSASSKSAALRAGQPLAVATPDQHVHTSAVNVAEPAAGQSLAPSSQQLHKPAMDHQLEPPSHDCQEALEAAASQLASDPHAESSADVLHRLLRNIAANPDEPKFRRLRLSNPKIQSAVLEAHGGVELLLACGFEIIFEESAGGTTQTEGFAVLDQAADLAPLLHAIHLLQQLAAMHPPTQEQQQQLLSSHQEAQRPQPQLQQGPAASPDSPPQTLAGEPPSILAYTARSSPDATQQRPAGAGALAPQQQARQARRERQWDPPCPRATQVLLPQSPASEMPDWFFSRTGAELKAAFMSAAKRREQDQALMTRAMRERSRGPSSQPTTHALIKVRLPEGICLQGEFGPGEPVHAVFAWVSDSLRDPGCTYDLILPSRKPLAAKGQAVREVPDLLPAVTLNFRWTGQSVVDMQTTPALRDDLLRGAHAGLQGL